MDVTTSELVQRLNGDLAAVVERVAPALVQVHSGVGGGAGTIWHPDGLIVTNAHVARGGPLAVTLADGRRLPARALARDPSRDLAALVVEAAGLPTMRIGDSRRLQAGQWVLALGHPWGVPGVVTAGVVIGLAATEEGGVWPGREWVVVSARLRPGYSGGPLVDAEGRLVGINTIMTGPATGMAVPVHVAATFLREALQREPVAA